jgi:WD40 repeat protein
MLYQQPGDIRAVAFSSDSRWLVAGGLRAYDHQIVVFQFNGMGTWGDGLPTHTITRPGGVYSLDFFSASASHSLLAVAGLTSEGEDGITSIFKFDEFVERRSSFQDDEIDDHLKQCTDIARPCGVLAIKFSPKGKWLALGDMYNRVALYDVGKLKHTRAQQPDPQHGALRWEHDRGINVTCVAFSPDSAWCVAGGEDQTAMIYLVDRGEPTPLCAIGRSAAIRAVAFLPAPPRPPHDSVDAGTIMVGHHSNSCCQLVVGGDDGVPVVVYSGLVRIDSTNREDVELGGGPPVAAIALEEKSVVFAGSGRSAIVCVSLSLISLTHVAFCPVGRNQMLLTLHDRETSLTLLERAIEAGADATIELILALPQGPVLIDERAFLLALSRNETRSLLALFRAASSVYAPLVARLAGGG